MRGPDKVRIYIALEKDGELVDPGAEQTKAILGKVFVGGTLYPAEGMWMGVYEISRVFEWLNVDEESRSVVEEKVEDAAQDLACDLHQDAILVSYEYPTRAEFSFVTCGKNNAILTENPNFFDTEDDD